MSKIDELFNILNKYKSVFYNDEEVVNEIKQFMNDEEKRYDDAGITKKYNDFTKYLMQNKGGR